MCQKLWNYDIGSNIYKFQIESSIELQESWSDIIFLTVITKF